MTRLSEAHRLAQLYKRADRLEAALAATRREIEKEFSVFASGRSVNRDRLRSQLEAIGLLPYTTVADRLRAEEKERA